MKILLLTVCFTLICPSLSYAVSLYANDGTYLGELSSNPYAAESTSNPYGRYGNRYSPTSINNPYSQYGSPYSSQSPNNPYANPQRYRCGNN